MVTPTLALFSSLLAASSALAHIQMSWPYPLHSSLNPATPEALKDYSMTSPLVTDGTYPCKGFITTADDMGSNAEWSAGSTINYTLVGTATHGGGSCQLSMSYDNGDTWSVIFSHIGGCPMEEASMTTDVTIPSDAPSGQALFAWGWFNLQGNREMYHNCAPVTITNGGSGLTNTDDYPTPFVANADVNDCVTIENTAVVFPNPGKTVKYGGDYSSSQPTEAAGFTGSNCVGPNASSSNSSSGSSSASSSGAATEASTAASESTAASGVSASAGISISLSASLGVGENAQATSSSSYVDASSPSSVSVSSSAASATTTSSSTSSGKSCKAKRALKAADNARARHVRRAPKRFAASKASHSSSKRDVSPEAVVQKRDGKRYAASKASHASAEKRTEGAGFEGRAGVKKSAASKASHPRDVKRGLVGRGIFETSS
ncbi:hypothetical protein L198_06105 [Cryptococcus wingfieldii CBS 7118]|uniref:DNA-directed RNA polymerase n=1 Tax=Cryptococcus wingfieldii CBS 7118 TaxID=1295528 RepID=A0A1E3IQH7_9TREE|nr:hypothetical protein L198_06105 [Cryptococcus wingfieldii CBS 7118]ODN90788.1 hypothetical protein L198_06105 [Cryptococcus wingfieldii CBS 7118]